MSNIINKFLLVGNKFMRQMHLKQSEFAYSSYGIFFLKKKKKKNKIKKADGSRYKYQNELDKACYHHDMAYEDLNI